jgi:ferric-dicitrate binding protein FerR (iron transport regulator)
MTPQKDFESIASLIIKFLKNEISEAESKQLQAWLAESEANRSLLKSFKATEDIQIGINALNQVDVEQEWENFKQHPQVKAKSWIRSWLPYAAALVVTFSCFGLYLRHDNHVDSKSQQVAYDVAPGNKKAMLELADGLVVRLDNQSSEQSKNQNFEVKEGTVYFKPNKENIQQNGKNALRTPRAGEYKVVLPDGTRVWLNASSYLSFPQSFNGDERRVELKGEAYFEVAHLPSKPFIVAFNNTQVKVFGTHFNINTYGKASTTTLIDGSVSVTYGTVERFLKPGEEALIDAGKIEVQPTEVYKSIAWKEGVFYFKEDQIKDVLDQIARWYDVQIAYEGPVNAQSITGSIRRQATLNQVLEMLGTVTHAKFNLKDKTVTVNFNQ